MSLCYCFHHVSLLLPAAILPKRDFIARQYWFSPVPAASSDLAAAPATPAQPDIETQDSKVRVIGLYSQCRVSNTNLAKIKGKTMGWRGAGCFSQGLRLRIIQSHTLPYNFACTVPSKCFGLIKMMISDLEGCIGLGKHFRFWLNYCSYRI